MTPLLGIALIAGGALLVGKKKTPKAAAPPSRQGSIGGIGGALSSFGQGLGSALTRAGNVAATAASSGGSFSRTAGAYGGKKACDAIGVSSEFKEFKEYCGSIGGRVAGGLSDLLEGLF